MKVGILTFHDAHNYGAVLQAFALKKYIKKLGFDTRIINYHHYTIPDGYPRENNEERWEKFNSFIQELIDYDKNVYTSEEELEKLDIDFWICGSDQIWNPEITRGVNKGFFLNFNTQGKKISYATSMGISKLPKEYEEEFKKCINQLNEISVREEELKLYLERITDKPVKKVMDPTFLLEKEEYNEFILENSYGEYILINELVPDIRLRQVAETLAKEKSVKVIEINDKPKENYFCKQMSSASIDEYLTLFKNAKAIVTNSFHGTVFSIIFGKEFYTIKRQQNRNSRIESMLDIVNMNDRLIDSIEELQNVKLQDYIKAYENLDKEINKSKEFLKNVLK